jgi:Coenzyme PQQ synthesis protein D (PqqD)
MFTNYKLKEDVDLVSLPDGTGILSDPANKKCHNLNAMGLLICQYLINGTKSREIVQHLHSQHFMNVEAQIIESDLSDFLDELKNHNLLIATDFN